MTMFYYHIVYVTHTNIIFFNFIHLIFIKFYIKYKIFYYRIITLLPT